MELFLKYLRPFFPFFFLFSILFIYIFYHIKGYRNPLVFSQIRITIFQILKGRPFVYIYREKIIVTFFELLS